MRISSSQKILVIPEKKLCYSPSSTSEKCNDLLEFIFFYHIFSQNERLQK